MDACVQAVHVCRDVVSANVCRKVSCEQSVYSCQLISKQNGHLVQEQIAAKALNVLERATGHTPTAFAELLAEMPPAKG